jgi:hypothetical protein
MAVAGLGDETLAARAADVRDVGARIARILRGETLALPDRPVIAIADDLPPSVTAEIPAAFCSASPWPGIADAASSWPAASASRASSGALAWSRRSTPRPPTPRPVRGGRSGCPGRQASSDRPDAAARAERAIARRLADRRARAASARGGQRHGGWCRVSRGEHRSPDDGACADAGAEGVGSSDESCSCAPGCQPRRSRLPPTPPSGVQAPGSSLPISGRGSHREPKCLGVG